MNTYNWIKRIGIMLSTIPVVFAISVETGWSQVGAVVTRVIPQIAVGSFDGGLTNYSTIIEIINPNATSVTVSGNFYNEDGTAADLTVTSNLAALPSVTNGSFSALTLDPSKVLVLTAVPNAATKATGRIAWARILTTLSVSYSAFIELRAASSNALQSRVGVPVSLANMAKFVIPRVRNVSAGLDTGFALVNTAATAAAMTITLKDALGGTIETRNLTIAGSSHRSLFTQEFFSLTNEPAGDNYHYIVFDAGNATQFAAVALAVEGADQTSLQVDVLR